MITDLKTALWEKRGLEIRGWNRKLWRKRKAKVKNKDVEGSKDPKGTNCTSSVGF